MSDRTAQDLYREMMNNAVSPLMRSAGFKRKGQSFEKRRHGYIAQVGFQKSVHNTKQDVSFTVNLSVVNPEIVEQHFRAWMPAVAYWGTEIVLLPTCGQWHGRIGEFMGVGDYWWSFRTRPQMEEVSRSVGSVLRDRALPLIERELDKPIISPSYVIETLGDPCGTHVNDAGEVIWHNVGGRPLWPVPTGAETAEREWGVPDLQTPPHTWPIPFRAVVDEVNRHAVTADGETTLCGLSAAGLQPISAFFAPNHPDSCLECSEAI